MKQSMLDPFSRKLAPSTTSHTPKKTAKRLQKPMTGSNTTNQFR